MLSQYELRTGTRFVTCGFIQFKCATKRISPVKIAVDAIVMDERLEKINPAKTVAQLMYIIDSYPSDHGA